MKKMIKIAFVAAFVAIAGYGVYANQKVDAMSDLMLANVERWLEVKVMDVLMAVSLMGTVVLVMGFM